MKRPIFVVHLQSTADCTDGIKALRELLKRALRSWGLRCTYLSEIPSPESASDTVREFPRHSTTAKGADTHNVKH
jgi:hypothetical protein